MGTHTHTPTADFRILENGTAYQTDAGMCGDYNSIIGMESDKALKRFFTQERTERLSPANGEATLSGVVVVGDIDTGLAKKLNLLLLADV